MPISRQSPFGLLGSPAEALVDNKATALLKNKAGMVLEASPLCTVVDASSSAENRQGGKLPSLCRTRE
jgi:hypothetical protein